MYFTSDMVLENEKIMNGKYQASFFAIFIEIYIYVLPLKIVKLDGFSYRTQRVAIGTTLSDEINLQYGVPQGSVLAKYASVITCLITATRMICKCI